MLTTKHSTASGTGGPELFTVNQVAALVNASPRTVYRLADAGKMPAPVRLGGLVRWRRGELDRWIADGCPGVRAIKAGR